MKDKAQKVILIISFIPYILQILCVGLVIYYTEFYESTSSLGWGENLLIDIWLSIVFASITPFAIGCFIYQIAYLIKYIKRKNAKKDLEETDVICDNVIEENNNSNNDGND